MTPSTLAGLQPLQATGRSRLPQGILGDMRPRPCPWSDPQGKLDSVPYQSSLSLGPSSLLLSTRRWMWRMSVDIRGNQMSGGGDRGMDQGTPRASFHGPSPGTQDRVIVPPSTLRLGGKSSHCKGRVPSPFTPPPSSTYFRKQKGKHPFHPSAKRISQ